MLNRQRLVVYSQFFLIRHVGDRPMELSTKFTQQAGVTVPIIGGAMYPCSNPELVAAVSRAGGLGIVQPVSLVFVHKHEFRAGLRRIKELAGGKPIGLNLLIEKSSKIYLERN